MFYLFSESNSCHLSIIFISPAFILSSFNLFALVVNLFTLSHPHLSDIDIQSMLLVVVLDVFKPIQIPFVGMIISKFKALLFIYYRLLDLLFNFLYFFVIPLSIQLVVNIIRILYDTRHPMITDSTKPDITLIKNISTHQVACIQPDSMWFLIPSRVAK